MTLPRYADRKSMKVVDNFVKNLVQHQPTSIPLLIKTINDAAEAYKNTYPT